MKKKEIKLTILHPGATDLDDELTVVLQKLNLIDNFGNVNFSSLKSGFSHSGGMISDDYVLIARDDKKLKYSLETQQKTLAAKSMGANIGSVLEVYHDEINGLVYELQNKVHG